MTPSDERAILAVRLLAVPKHGVATDAYLREAAER